MTSASLAVSVIGLALAQARGLLTKHAVKQVDRLLSNQGVVVWDMFAPWVAEVVGRRTDIVVAMDWTDFDADDQTTLALNLVTDHGRATPLLWLTVFKDELKDRRNNYEDLCLARLAEVLPKGVKVTILADPGFGDTKLFAYLARLGFAYVIRFRGNIHDVTLRSGTMPRKPMGGKALTDPERQARDRAARAERKPAIRTRRPLDHRSRAQRWRHAVAELSELQDQYEAWLHALPANLCDSATAEALQAICDVQLAELQAIEPPRGFAETDLREPDRPINGKPKPVSVSPARLTLHYNKPSDDRAQALILIDAHRSS